MMMWLSAQEVVARLRERGFRVSHTALHNWANRHDGIARQFGYRRVFHPQLVDLLAEGVPLSEIAARLAAPSRDAA